MEDRGWTGREGHNGGGLVTSLMVASFVRGHRPRMIYLFYSIQNTYRHIPLLRTLKYFQTKWQQIFLEATTDIPYKDVTDHYQDFKLDIYFLFLPIIAI